MNLLRQGGQQADLFSEAFVTFLTDDLIRQIPVTLAVDQGVAGFSRFLFTNRVDQLVAQWTFLEDIAWALADHLGTIRDMIGNAGHIGQHIQYTAFGAPKFTVPVANTHPHAFTGRVWDSIPSMSFHRARFYDVGSGRFVSIDPIGFEAKDKNLLRYVGNSPLLNVDLSGQMAFVDFAVLAGAIVGAVALQDCLDIIFPEYSEDWGGLVE